MMLSISVPYEITLRVQIKIYPNRCGNTTSQCVVQKACFASLFVYNFTISLCENENNSYFHKTSSI